MVLQGEQNLGLGKQNEAQGIMGESLAWIRLPLNCGCGFSMLGFETMCENSRVVFVEVSVRQGVSCPASFLA